MLPGHHPRNEAPTSLGLDYLQHSELIQRLLAGNQTASSASPA
jgi:hypothetical protein